MDLTHSLDLASLVTYVSVFMQSLIAQTSASSPLVEVPAQLPIDVNWKNFLAYI